MVKSTADSSCSTKGDVSLWRGTNRIARVHYRAAAYRKISVQALRAGVSATDLARTQFPFLFTSATKPVLLSLEFTNVCNLRCVYCHTLIPRKRVNGVMSDVTFEHVINNIRDAGVERVKVVGGGEPTLHPRFGAYVRRLADVVKHLAVVTNAHWRTPEVMTALAAHVDLIEISIDIGGKEQFEKSRGNGSYSRLMKNLQSLSELKRKGLINIRLMARPSNRHLATQERDFYRRWADSIMLQHIESLEALGYTHDVYTPDTTYFGTYPKCTSPFKNLEIKWDGDIPLCGPNSFDEPRRISLGNIRKDSLHDVWNGPVLSQYRRAHRRRIEQDMPVCWGCKAF